MTTPVAPLTQPIAEQLNQVNGRANGTRFDAPDDGRYVSEEEYYILDPSAEHMRFYQRTSAGHYIEIAPDAEGVIHSSVLPGFQFRLGDLYRLPTLETLALDEVYQGYMLLHYQAALTQAEEERRRAEEERQRAEAETVARQVAEARAEAEARACQTAEAEIVQLRAALARLRTDTH